MNPEETITNEELEIKRKLITDIIQDCAVGMKYGLDDVFLALAFRSIPELKKIASESNIKTD